MELRPFLQLTQPKILWVCKRQTVKKTSYQNFMPTLFVIREWADLREIQTACKESQGRTYNVRNAMELRINSITHILTDQKLKLFIYIQYTYRKASIIQLDSFFLKKEKKKKASLSVPLFRSPLQGSPGFKSRVSFPSNESWRWLWQGIVMLRSLPGGIRHLQSMDWISSSSALGLLSFIFIPFLSSPPHISGQPGQHGQGLLCGNDHGYSRCYRCQCHTAWGAGRHSGQCHWI